MAFPTGTTGQIDRAAMAFRRRRGLILAAALTFLAAGVFATPGLPQAGFLAVGLTLGMVVVWSVPAARTARAREARIAAALPDLIGNDLVPGLLTDAEGRILYSNRAAQEGLKTRDVRTLAGALLPVLANPGAVLFRMETRARAQGAAYEDLVTRNGHLRISVHRAGEERFLWRVERSVERALSAADQFPLPMLTLGRNDAILFMNGAARDLIGERVRTLDRICPDLPLRSGQMNAISTSEGVQSCLAVERAGMAGRRELFLLPGITGPECPPEEWTFFDELPVPLLKIARNGAVQLSNRPARALLGVETCRDKALGDLMEGLGRSLPDWLDDAAAGRGTVHSETLRIKRSDREVYVQVTLNPVTEEGETVLVAVMHDATKLKSLEAQFVQSQKMQAIGQLAGGVAHDFNNLLTAISGHCDLLLLRHDQGDADYADLVQINQNANRAAALVGQLLAYSRKQTLRPEAIDLRDALSDLAHLLNRLVGEKVTLSLSHDPDLPMIRADKRQLEQVLMNLVVNARDAMPDGGEIRIVTENLLLEAPLRRDRAVVAAGRYVRVSVTDEGEGIPADRLGKVFEPFFTTKRTGEGTGLGLSTAYGIIKQTGGFIFVDSTVGAGTCFQILLPAHDRRDEPVREMHKPVPAVTPAEGIILLVEDEAPVRAFASRALQLRGLTVLEADSAESALELLQDSDLRVDVFVTDVVMPGMDGPGWVRKALVDRPDVSVVFMSGYAEETFGDTQARIPNSVFLPKPFSLTELTEMVQRQLSRSGLPPPGTAEPAVSVHGAE